MSLSARRAWIEISKGFISSRLQTVALRKESVDRNTACRGSFMSICLSLSARRAWIEILLLRVSSALLPVALRKESVDRNGLSYFYIIKITSRSPQGERG